MAIQPLGLSRHLYAGIRILRVLVAALRRLLHAGSESTLLLCAFIRHAAPQLERNTFGVAQAAFPSTKEVVRFAR